MHTKTRKIAMTGMLCALTYVVMAVGRVPVVLFLKYDPSDIVVTLGGLVWGPMTAFTVSVTVAVAELLLPVFLPFNLLKGGLNASVTFLLYKPVVTALRQSGLAPAGAAQAGGRPVGLLLAAAFVAASCVLFILSWNGIL